MLFIYPFGGFLFFSFLNDVRSIWEDSVALRNQVLHDLSALPLHTQSNNHFIKKNILNITN